MDLFPLPAEVWGTVGQWVSAIGTTAAFSATYYVIRRDSKIRRRTQARKVVFYAVPVDLSDEVPPEEVPPYAHNLILHNVSEEPIYDVYFERWDTRYDSKTFPEKVLLPGTSTTLTEPLWASGAVDSYQAGFRDNGGLRWIRRLDGELREIFGPLSRPDPEAEDALKPPKGAKPTAD